MPIKKLVPKVPDPYISKNELNQFWPARFGHLDYLIDQINATSSTTTNGISGSVKIISGSITPTQWTTLHSDPIPIYTNTANAFFMPLSGMIKYSYDPVLGVPPCDNFGLYYDNGNYTPVLIVYSTSWSTVVPMPTGIINMLSDPGQVNAIGSNTDVLVLGSGTNIDCPGTIMNTSTYFIVGLEVIT